LLRNPKRGGQGPIWAVQPYDDDDDDDEISEITQQYIKMKYTNKNK
jgi:hypothetical protein